MKKMLLSIGAILLIVSFLVGAGFGRKSGFDLEDGVQAFGLAFLGLMLIYGVLEAVAIVRHKLGWGPWH